MNRPFGAEIELTGMTQEQAVRILRLLGFEVRNEAYNHETRTWWKIVPDGSVTGGFEVVSPILRGTEGLEALKTLIIGLDDAGGRIDRRCGLHVHFDGGDLGLEDLRSLIADTHNMKMRSTPSCRRADAGTGISIAAVCAGWRSGTTFGKRAMFLNSFRHNPTATSR